MSAKSIRHNLYDIYRKGKPKEMYKEIDLDQIDVNREPPAEEPARQYYFMKAAKAYVRQISGRKGSPLTFHV